MEVSSTLPIVNEISYASLSDRIQSTFIDSIVIVVLMMASASALENYDNAPDWIRIALFFGIWGIYEPVCMTFGATLGNYLKGIRVRRRGNYSKRINLLQAFVRYMLKMTLGWISFLTIHASKERQAIHDLVAGSVALKKNSA
ncbi:MAG: RDD family protein [Proteobacteria bacterium]|nr:MAG: RDD family protein [Pseudomonadota bacterium]